jgi:hypothetical protein
MRFRELPPRWCLRYLAPGHPDAPPGVPQYRALAISTPPNNATHASAQITASLAVTPTVSNTSPASRSILPHVPAHR